MRDPKRKIFVTGASGLIGSWLCGVLAKLGDEVYGLVRPQAKSNVAFNVLQIEKRITIIKGDILDYDTICSSLRSIRPDLIVDLAAKTSVRESLSSPRDTFLVNTIGPLNILEACRSLDLPSHIVSLSTDLALEHSGNGSRLLKGLGEKHQVGHGEPYGTSKAAMELVCRCYQRSFFSGKQQVAIVRLANVFGYCDANDKRVIPLFITHALRDGIIPLKYRENGRQFLFISDAIIGLIKALRYLLSREVPNVEASMRPRDSQDVPAFHFALEHYEGTAEPFVRMKDLAKLVSLQVGGRVDDKASIEYAPGEIEVQAMSCKDTCAALNWQPFVQLAEGIARVAKWQSLLQADPSSSHKQLELFLEKEVDTIIDHLAVDYRP